MPKTGGVPANRNTVTIPTTGHLWREISGAQLYGPLVGRVQELAGTARAFHWPLEFPDVMAAGGFDVVLGNPPWEVMQLGEEEYFAQHLPEIAELAGAVRKRAIAALEKENPLAFSAYQADKRQLKPGMSSPVHPSVSTLRRGKRSTPTPCSRNCSRISRARAGARA